MQVLPGALGASLIGELGKAELSERDVWYSTPLDFFLPIYIAPAPGEPTPEMDGVNAPDQGNRLL